MATLTKVSDELATNPNVQQIFSTMQQAVGAIPEPLRMLAVSPGLLKVQSQFIKYYGGHGRLSGELLTCIRYTAASCFDNQACIKFNGDLLLRQGMTDSELAMLTAQPLSAPLEEKDLQMLALVVKAVNGGTATTKEMDKLHELGFTDQDIVDAVNHGFAMYSPGRMMAFFGLTV